MNKNENEAFIIFIFILEAQIFNGSIISVILQFNHVEEKTNTNSFLLNINTI